MNGALTQTSPNTGAAGVESAAYTADQTSLDSSTTGGATRSSSDYLGRCGQAAGDASPPCSASVQQFFRASFDISPCTTTAARRRVSTRAKRPAIRPIRSPYCARHRSSSTLAPAATARSFCVVTNQDHRAVAAPRPTPTRRRSRSTTAVLGPSHEGLAGLSGLVHDHCLTTRRSRCGGQRGGCPRPP